MVGYIDEDEQDLGLTARLVASIRRQCVSVPTSKDSAALTEMRVWCYNNIGPRRPHHPIHEAEEGYIDYLEGNWAMGRDHTAEDNNSISFWFADSNDYTQFVLTWLGDAP
jgi:hypothetical protein